MNRFMVYGTTVFFLAIAHMYALGDRLPDSVPVFVLPGIVSVYLSLFMKKIPIDMNPFQHGWNGMLWGVQLLLLATYLYSETNAINFAPLLSFFAVEFVRDQVGKRVSEHEREKQQYEVQLQQVNDTFRVVRVERHDFLKHVATLQFLLEKQEHEDARGYLESLVGKYNETNLTIRGERGAVAGILHQMYSQAQTLGMMVVYDLDVPLSSLPLKDQQIVSLIGNLLTNAVEASAEWQRKNHRPAEISLQFYKRSGLYLLTCKNQSNPIPIRILDELYRSYGHTTKDGGHKGLGTKVIHDLVVEANGVLDFVHKDEEFMVKIKIPAIHG